MRVQEEWREEGTKLPEVLPSSAACCISGTTSCKYTALAWSHSSLWGQECTSEASEERKEKMPDAEVFHPLDNFARVPFCLPSNNLCILRHVRGWKAAGCLVLSKQRSEVRVTIKGPVQRLATSLSVSWRANAMCRILVGKEGLTDSEDCWEQEWVSGERGAAAWLGALEGHVMA